MKKFVGNNELIIHNISLLLTKINIDSPHTFFYSVKFWVVFLGVFFIEGGGCLFLKRLFLYFCRSSV